MHHQSASDSFRALKDECSSNTHAPEDAHQAVVSWIVQHDALELLGSYSEGDSAAGPAADFAGVDDHVQQFSVPLPDEISFNAAISACEKVGQLRFPDVISSSASISASEKGGAVCTER